MENAWKKNSPDAKMIKEFACTGYHEQIYAPTALSAKIHTTILTTATFAVYLYGMKKKAENGIVIGASLENGVLHLKDALSERKDSALTGVA